MNSNFYLSRAACVLLAGLAVCVIPATAEETHAVALTRLGGVDSVIEQAVADGSIPGAVLVVGHDGAVVYRKAYGHRALEPKLEPMTLDTVFDLASLTKVIATTTAVMQLVERGRVRLNDPVAKYLPEFAQNGKEDITVRQLLTHYSGMAPDIELTPAFDSKESAYRLAFAETPQQAPGSGFVYSDTNFIVLGAMVEKVAGETLDAYTERHIFVPLKMARTRFLPPAAWRAKIAPTEYDEHEHMLRGVVHDPRARRMGGVAGHAGLFSTGDDLAKFAQALLNGGGGILSPLMVEKMTSPETPPAAAVLRGFGWDIDSPFSSNRGDLLPVGSFGHTGWTGTSIWIDPTTETYIILLTNAVHPRGKGNAIGLRSKVATEVASALNLTVSEKEALRWKSITGYNEALSAGRRMSTRNGTVKTGIDVLEEHGFDVLKAAGQSADTKNVDATKVDSKSSDANSVDANAATAKSEDAKSDVANSVANSVGENGAVAQNPNPKKRIGLVTNQTGVDGLGIRTIDVLANAPGISLTAIFSPEHGVTGTLDTTDVNNSKDAATGVPVYSVYGGTDAARRPPADVMKSLDAVVFDIQDAGAPFYTYETTLGYFLEGAAKAGVELIVLDRPNPVTGSFVQGPVADAGRESFTNYWTVPVRHGMTLGELAKMFNAERNINAKLTVVPMEGWQRGDWFDSTGLVWVNPSPNLRSVNEAALYPGVALIEGTNISVGRGTDTPFELVGAPWVKSKELAAYLNARGIAGVRFVPVTFTPTSSVYSGQTCSGVNVILTDRNGVDSPELGIELAAALHKLYAADFKIERMSGLLVNQNAFDALVAGQDPRRIAQDWQEGLAAFQKMREKYLIYK
jgi:uncharacterized protein YbbC (DUF1343 family)/CubicO group peptidase (beta-lactamase class C family)